MGGEERRQFPRIERRLMVNYRCPALAQVDWGASPAKDISIGGLRFVAERDYPKGALLELQVFLPGLAKPLAMSATVVWTRPVGTSRMTEYGLMFSEPSPDAQQAIQKFVDFFLQKQSRDRE